MLNGTVVFIPVNLNSNFMLLSLHSGLVRPDRIVFHSLLDKTSVLTDLIVAPEVLVMLVKHEEMRAFTRSVHLHLQLVFSLTEKLAESDWIVGAR